ncbi:MAG: DUF1444 family protein [Planctomycetales bacterium]|nr:DUF1444 family protein [Planctomycetales bacterium]
MEFFDRFRREPNRDDFARLLIERIRDAGEVREIQYDADSFRLLRGEQDQGFLSLSNLYAEYCRAEAESRERIVEICVRNWFVTDSQIPEDFEDARHDLLPSLRSRAYVDFMLRRLELEGNQVGPATYEIIGEHLAAGIVYDLPTSMCLLDQENLDKWGVTLYEALEVAKANLLETTKNYIAADGFYLMAHGDSYDATRMLLTELVSDFEVDGDVIAMAPNREVLAITGSADEAGLQRLLDVAEEGVRHERYVSGLAFRLEAGDAWTVWLPPREHPLYQRFKVLNTQALGQDYHEQKELLELECQQQGASRFIATYSGMTHQETGDITSYCVWGEGVDTLLPKADLIFLLRARPDGKPGELAAAGPWDDVRRIVGDLMEPLDMYPVRYRVREFPDDEMLRAIGGEHWQP